ncbi:MAG: hypothetical protein NT090_23020 [Acidobacteria bacterium]|nr:hypothetical protein [Acidobacteriota bacterium]
MRRREWIASMAGAASGAPAPPQERFVGITVMPEYIQAEGVDRVIENIRHRAGATAVCTSPYVMAPADEKTGSREPPIDAGAGKVRLLDRPLWGRRELFVRTAPAFAPDPALYRGLRYQPPPPEELTRRDGARIGEFLRAARKAGLRVYFQIQAASPPGYRVQFGGPADEDRPRLPDGRIPPRRVDNNASLASPEVRRYTEALIHDLCRAWPELDGIRVDWPEYPPYFLDGTFLDFSRPAQQAAERMGFPFERMRREALEAYRLLHGGLTNRQLESWMEADGGRFALAEAISRRPGLAELFRFKAALAEELLAGFRKALTQAGGESKELVPNLFPPPFSLVSGADFGRAARHSSALSVKLYTMHWPMIVRFHAETLLEANPGLSERLVVGTLARLMDVADNPSDRLSDYRYPEPDEPHPAGAAAQARKIRQARASAAGAPVNALAHGYGPLDDFRERLRTAWQASGGRVWVNRYGYLRDAKLDAIRQVCADHRLA